MADLELTLSWLDMSQYLDRFLDAGFDSWETVLEITEDDLEALNVDLGHRRKLQREIANTRRLAQDPAFVVPLYPTIGDPHHDGRFTGNRDDVQPPSQGKRGYRHHPKPNPNAPERPYSAYVLFSNHMREELKAQSLSFTEISRRVGESWQTLPPEEKERWKQRTAQPWEKYKADLAEYQKSDNYKQYVQYVADFKRAQARKRCEASHRKSEEPSPTSPTTYLTGVKRPLALPTSQIKGMQPESSKVSIRRVKRESDAGIVPGGGPRIQRISQACEQCRQRKTRCPGERPFCQNCKSVGCPCVYADGKRDMEKKLVANLWQKLAAYEKLLLSFIPQVDDDDQTAIQTCLLMAPQLEEDRELRNASKSSSIDCGGEDVVSGVGSVGSPDNANEEDFQEVDDGKKSQAFIGQASEEKWLQRLELELSGSNPGDRKHKLPTVGPASARSVQKIDSTESFPYSEDLDSSVVGNQIDPYGLPVKATADALVNVYFVTVHPTFPIIDQTSFFQQYEDHFSLEENESFKDRTFFAILQLVFAIGAVHAHRTGAEWAGDDRDHLLYFARARILGVEMGVLNDLVYYGQVQVFGLGGMYFTVIHQINRAWTTVGLAIRCAQALGMHLQNVTPMLPDAEKEFRGRIWHSTISLERALTVITGRPSMIRARDCTVPLPSLSTRKESFSDTQSSNISHAPSPMEAARDLGSFNVIPAPMPDSAKSPAYFLYYVELNTLAQAAVTKLYAPEVKHLKWAKIQKRITELDQELLQWSTKVSKTFDVQTPPVNPQSEAYRTALGILFNSTRAIIHRPCLCRLDRRIPHQSKNSHELNLDCAKKCVHAARAILAHLPDRFNLQVFHSGPLWWLLHPHLKRACTVLILELAYRARHMPSESEDILLDAKKAVNWLHAISTTSGPATRSWLTLSRLLKLAAHKVGGNTADIVDPDDQFPTQFSDHRPPPTTGPFAPNHGAAGSSAWPSLEGNSRDQLPEPPLFGDLETLGLDQFGFSPGIGFPNLFPTASEMEGMAGQEQNEDTMLQGGDDATIGDDIGIAQWYDWKGDQRG